MLGNQTLKPTDELLAYKLGCVSTIGAELCTRTWKGRHCSEEDLWGSPGSGEGAAHMRLLIHQSLDGIKVLF